MRNILVQFLAAMALLAAENTPKKSFAVEVSGNPKGKAVILIPGLSSSGDVWQATVAHLAPKYQCHVLTLAGFAGQPRYSDSTFLAQVRDDLATYIETNKLKQPILIGHSLGGTMALWLASQQPALPGPLVIVDSLPNLGAAMNPDPAAVRKMAEGMRAGIVSQTKDQYAAYMKSSGIIESMVGPRDHDQVLAWSLNSDPVAVGNAMFELYTTNLSEDIAKIKSPALVLTSWVAYKAFSTREKSLAMVEAQYTKMPSKTIHVSDTAKHFIMLDDPTWFFAELDAFLK